MNEPDNFDQRIYDEASTLSLRDAAFLLWLKRGLLRRAKSIPSAPAITGTDTQTRLAYQDLTFDRLKRTHPTADDDEAKEAIKAAARLQENAWKYYKDTGELARDVQNAVKRAQAESPEFQEETYSKLNYDIGWVLSR